MNKIKIVFAWTKRHLLKMLIFNGRVEDRPTQQDIIRGMKKEIKHDSDTACGPNRDDGLRG